jgi:hypothetical protein
LNVGNMKVHILVGLDEIHEAGRGC